VKQKPVSNNKKHPTAAAVRTVKYSATELLILSQEYIKSSENPIEGTFWRNSKLWDDVSECYKKPKAQQEVYDERYRKQKWYMGHSLCQSTSNKFLDSDDDDGAKQSILPRTTFSLQQKWSKFVQSLVTEFIGLTVHHPKQSR
jgi:hypothetical protein